METQEIEKKLAVLTEELNRPERINNNSGIRILSFQTSLEELRSHLDDVRVGFKYLVFDVEATRRENEFLKKQNKELEIRLSANGR